MAKKKTLKPAKKAKSGTKKTAPKKGIPKKAAAKKSAGKKTGKTLKPKVSSVPQKLPAKSNARPKSTASVEFSPLRDFVLVQRLQEAEKTAGGLYIPATALEKPMLGKVLSVGPGAIDKKGRKRPMDVKAGDQVLFGKYAGTEIQIGGENFLVLRETDILGVSNEGV